MAQALRVHDKPQQVTRTDGQVQRGRAMPVVTPFDEIERLFDDLLPSSLFRFGRSPMNRSLMDAQARTPRIDVIERDSEILLRAEVPGIGKEDLDISVDENSVTIRGATAREESEAEGDYYRREIVSGEFARSVALPSAVDADKVEATLSDGVLELVMPKLEVARRRKVTIK